MAADNDAIKLSSQDAPDAMGTDPAKRTAEKFERPTSNDKWTRKKSEERKYLSYDLGKASEKLVDLSEAAFIEGFDKIREEMNTAATAIEKNVKEVQADMVQTTNSFSKARAGKNISRKETLPIVLQSPSKELAFPNASRMTTAAANVSRTFVEITKAAQAAIDNSTATKIILSTEFEEDVSETEVGGVAITATSISLLQGGNIAVSGAAGLGAALLAVTKGPTGDALRQIGDLAWNVGRRVVRLSEDAELTDRIVTINSAVLARAIELLENNERGDKFVSTNDQSRDLRDLTLAMSAFYDEFNKELERLESDSLQDSCEYKTELRMLEKDVKQLMREVQLP